MKTPISANAQNVYLCYMKAKLAITSFVYVTVLVILSFTWSYLYNFLNDTSREMKGDDIFFCLEVIGILTYLYIIIVRMYVKNLLPYLLVFVTPFLTCVLTIIFVLLLSTPFNLDNDYESLQAYFYLHGIITMALIYFVIKTAKTRS